MSDDLHARNGVLLFSVLGPTGRLWAPSRNGLTEREAQAMVAIGWGQIVGRRMTRRRLSFDPLSSSTAPPEQMQTAIALTDEGRSKLARLCDLQTGICRECSCTDARACEGGCSWVDAAHTLCSKCGVQHGRLVR